MSGSQIDALCREWLGENYGEEIATEYKIYSLVIPMWNFAILNNALEELRLELCFSSGPKQSFGSTDYYEAREKLALLNGKTPLPEVFIRAFVTKSGKRLKEGKRL